MWRWEKKKIALQTKTYGPTLPSLRIAQIDDLEKLMLRLLNIAILLTLVLNLIFVNDR